MVIDGLTMHGLGTSLPLEVSGVRMCSFRRGILPVWYKTPGRGFLGIEGSKADPNQSLLPFIKHPPNNNKHIGANPPEIIPAL